MTEISRIIHTVLDSEQAREAAHYIAFGLGHTWGRNVNGNCMHPGTERAAVKPPHATPRYYGMFETLSRQFPAEWLGSWNYGFSVGLVDIP